MQIFNYPNENSQSILALGPESNGNFSVFSNSKIYFSEDFRDLLVDANFNRFKKELNAFLRKEKIRPSIVLTDLHPLYRTTALGKDLAKKYKAEHIQVQHHIAHIFSQVVNDIFQDTRYKIQDTKKNQNSKLKTQNFFGIALDGTGYGTDGKIWGGEIFGVKSPKSKVKSIERIGHLENQLMIGGDLAVQEPARMLISILDKFSIFNFQFSNNAEISKFKNKKDFIYSFLKKYYSKQEFEILYNQLQQNFNCIETSSTGRVLDAVSVLLGFAKNERKEKHEATYFLERNSTRPYKDLRPKILEIQNSTLEIDSKLEIRNSKFILNTTHLFEYLVKNLHRDKKRLAATAQLYIAEGLDEIISQSKVKSQKSKVYISGGISNNKIISAYFESKNKKAGIPSGTPTVQIPRGDAGLSLGQVIYFLLNQ